MNGASIAGAVCTRHEAVGGQPLDDPRHVAVRHHQQARQLGHRHARVGARQRRQHVELRQRDAEADAEPLDAARLPSPACAQQPQPQAEPLLRRGARSAGARARAGIRTFTRRPPELTMACPVVAAAAGVQRRRTTAATSSGVTSRPPGLDAASSSRTAARLRPVAATIASSDAFEHRGLGVARDRPRSRWRRIAPAPPPARASGR